MQYQSIWVGADRKLVKMEKTLPQQRPTEVVVSIKACGICGTDMHFYRDLPEGKLTPLGHEVAGVVAAVGDDVSGLSVGDRVVVQNHVACGSCGPCLNQRPDACRNIRTYMNDQAGMGEYLIVPRTMVIPFSGLGFAEATLAEPVTVALDLCREASVRLHDSVLVIGPGTIGLSCVPIVRKQGARIVVVAGHGLGTVRGDHRRSVALELGAQEYADTSRPNWKEDLLSRYPEGFDRVIVTSPPATISDGISLAGFRGWVVYDGIDYVNDAVTFSANDFHFAKKRLIASHAIPNWGFPQALDLLRDGTIPPRLLLTHRYRLDDLGKAFEDYGSADLPIIKTVIDIPGEAPSMDGGLHR